MTTNAVRLLDRTGHVVATGNVIEKEGLYTGQLDLTPMAPDVRRVFEEYERIVNGQLFSLLDEAEDRVQGLSITARFEDDTEQAVEDLQVYPSTNKVSFRLTRSAAAEFPAVAEFVITKNQELYRRLGQTPDSSAPSAG